MKKIFQLFLVLTILISSSAFAQSHHSTNHSSYSGTKHHSSSYNKTYKKKNSSTSYHKSTSPKVKSSNKSHAYGVQRDSHGKIKRSSSARHAFMKQTGYPHGRPGYIIDHIKPLKEGGCDCPENMQWQTKEAAKAKDKWE